VKELAVTLKAEALALKLLVVAEASAVAAWAVVA